MSDHRDITVIGLLLFLTISVPTVIIGYLTDNPNWSLVVVSLFSTIALILIYWYIATTTEEQKSVGERQAIVAETHAEIAERQKEIAEWQAELMEKQVEIDQHMQNVVQSEYVPKVTAVDLAVNGNEVSLELENIGQGHAVDLRATCELLVPDQTYDGVAVPLTDHSQMARLDQRNTPENISDMTHNFFGPPFDSVETSLYRSGAIANESQRWKALPREKGSQLRAGETQEFSYKPEFDNRGGEADSQYTPLSMVLDYLQMEHNRIVARIRVICDDIIPDNTNTYVETVFETAGPLQDDTNLQSIVEDTTYHYDSRFGDISSKEEMYRSDDFE